MAKPKFLQCAVCGNQQPYEPFVPAICKKCESQWLEASYDYETFKRDILRGLPGRPEALAPTLYIDRDWSAEPWARGCPTGFLPPGVFTTFGRALREPVDRPNKPPQSSTPWGFQAFLQRWRPSLTET